MTLASGDEQWRNLTAMDKYYENGPLPTWLGWYVQQWPHWYHAATALLTLVVELFVVLLLFFPGRSRRLCFLIVTPLQIGIILENQKDVLRLFRGNPFPEAPRQVRAVLWRYRFTSPDEKRRTGNWWQREWIGIYAPTAVRGADGTIAFGK